MNFHIKLSRFKRSDQINQKQHVETNIDLVFFFFFHFPYRSYKIYWILVLKNKSSTIINFFSFFFFFLRCRINPHKKNMLVQSLSFLFFFLFFEEFVPYLFDCHGPLNVVHLSWIRSQCLGYFVSKTDYQIANHHHHINDKQYNDDSTLYKSTLMM